jgi:hypothetical protein
MEASAKLHKTAALRAEKERLVRIEHEVRLFPESG